MSKIALQAINTYFFTFFIVSKPQTLTGQWRPKGDKIITMWTEPVAKKRIEHLKTIPEIMV